MSSVVRQLRSYPQQDSSYDSRLKNPSRSVYPYSRFFENPLVEAEFSHRGLLIVHSCCWWVGVLIGVVWRVPYGGSGGPYLLESRGLLRVEHGSGAVLSANGTRTVQENLGTFLRI